MSGRLAGKVAVVTGASEGIGRAVALALAAEGARVAVTARRSEGARIDEGGPVRLPIVRFQAVVQARSDWLETTTFTCGTGCHGGGARVAAG